MTKKRQKDLIETIMPNLIPKKRQKKIQEVVDAMKAEPLSKTNPYLKDKKKAKKLIERSVETSCGVEGIKIKKKTSLATDRMIEDLDASKLPKYVLEHKFLTDRRFRFDFAWPDYMLYLEVDGMVWTGGRHTSGAGFTRDHEKFNLAHINGWVGIRATSGQVRDGSAIKWIHELFKTHGNKV